MSAVPEGGSGPGPPQVPLATKQSYADRAKMNVRYDQRLKRNVLDIEIEKNDVKDEMFLNQDVVAKLLQNIGMKIDTHVEGYQVTYGGKSGKISVLCKDGIDLERFCRQECFEVCKGVMTKNIRPSGRKDITVTVSGLDFNTPDTLVQEYISKFGGTMVSNNVIYARHGEGPFKGKLNGDRKYQVDMTTTTSTMGTYHYLDGERVRVYYRGNTKTCGRCHQGAQQCRGGGIARECQNEGGARKDLLAHMKEVWLQIGFSPTTFKIPEREIEDEDGNFGGDQKILDMVTFPRQVNQPALTTPEKEKFTKAKITNFPVEITDAEALAFMNEKVDKAITLLDMEMIRNERSSQIVLGPGPNKAAVIKAIETLDFYTTQKLFYPDRKLYAKPVKPLSPLKQTQPEPDNSNDSVDNKVKSAVVNLENRQDIKTPVKATSNSQAKKSSATTAPIAKHKQGLASGAVELTIRK